MCLLHRENLRDARDGGGEGGTVHAHAGEDLLTPSHVTTTAVALTGGRGAERIWGPVAFGILIRASHKGDHRMLWSGTQ